MASRSHSTAPLKVRTAFGTFDVVQVMKTHTKATVAGPDTTAGHQSHTANGPVHSTSYNSFGVNTAFNQKEDVLDFNIYETEGVRAHLPQGQSWTGTNTQPTPSPTLTSNLPRTAVHDEVWTPTNLENPSGSIDIAVAPPTVTEPVIESAVWDYSDQTLTIVWDQDIDVDESYDPTLWSLNDNDFDILFEGVGIDQGDSDTHIITMEDTGAPSVGGDTFTFGGEDPDVTYNDGDAELPLIVNYPYTMVSPPPPPA